MAQPGFLVSVLPTPSPTSVVPGSAAVAAVVNPVASMTHGPADLSGCRVYVGNLHYELQEPQVRALFSPFGNIRTVDMSFEPTTGKTKGYAFVEYDDPASARQALEALNGIQLVGRTIKVGLPASAQNAALQAVARPVVPAIVPTALGGMAPKKIYVGGVHFALSPQHIRDVFAVFGEIVECHLIPDAESGNHKGYGFIEYKEPGSAETAIRQMNGFEIAGLKLKVGWAQQSLTPTPVMPIVSSLLPTAMPIAAALPTPIVPVQQPQPYIPPPSTTLYPPHLSAASLLSDAANGEPIFKQGMAELLGMLGVYHQLKDLHQAATAAGLPLYIDEEREREVERMVKEAYGLAPNESFGDKAGASNNNNNAADAGSNGKNYLPPEQHASLFAKSMQDDAKVLMLEVQGNESEAESIVAELATTCGLCGKVDNISLRGPSPNCRYPRIFVTFVDSSNVDRAQEMLDGRRVGTFAVNASSYDPFKFAQGEFE